MRVAIFLKYFSLWAEFRFIISQLYNGLHVIYPLFLPICDETWILSTYFTKIKIKRTNRFHENRSSVDGATRRLAGRDRQTWESLFAILQRSLKINKHPSSYITENTLLIHYKENNQLIPHRGKIKVSFWKSYEIYKRTVCCRAFES
jgi:hypothetical protein